MTHLHRIVSLLVAAVFAISLIACSSSSRAPTTLSGTAATGAGIIGTVFVTDANGTERSVDTAADGSGRYTIDVSGMTPPFIIKIVPAGGTGATLYSYADSANMTINITPLTDLALFIANGNTDLTTAYTTWDGTQFSAASVRSSQATVNANLQAQITAAGLDATVYDFFSTAFDADNTGIDAVLDAITVDTSSGAVMLNVIGVAGGTVVIPAVAGFTFDPAIDTSGINVGGGNTGGGNTGGGSTGGVTNGDATIAANEILATIPADIAGTYDLVFSEFNPGSGITDGTMTTVIVGTDGILRVGNNIVLGTPVFRNGNEAEAIWKDTVNGNEYALSALQSTGIPASIFNEINVGAPDGSAFYGQYKVAAGGGTGGGTGGSTTGTPVVADDGTGAFAATAGFYRIAVSSLVNAGEITLFDVYLSSTGEAISTGLGGNLPSVPNSGTAKIYKTTLVNASGEIHLLVDGAFGTNSSLRLFETSSTGGSYTTTYGLTANKIAEAPFNGGPSTAPSGTFLPQFFTDRAGGYSVSAASAPVIGSDTTFTLSGAYSLVIATDGSVSLATDGNTINLTWSENTDTFSDGTISNVTFTRTTDPAIRIVIVQFLNGNLESVTVTPSTPGVVGTWRLTP